MPSEPLSALPTTSTLTGTEGVPLVQSGVTKTAAASTIAGLVVPSQIVPATGAQATFGGTQNYKFPAAIGATVNSMTSYCPPVYSYNGAASIPTEHIVRGTISIAVGSGVTGAQVNINLTGAAVFTNANSYTVMATFSAGGSTIPAGWTVQVMSIYTNRNSGSTIQVFVIESGAASTGSGTINVDFVAIGY